MNHSMVVSLCLKFLVKFFCVCSCFTKAFNLLGDCIVSLLDHFLALVFDTYSASFVVHASLCQVLQGGFIALVVFSLLKYQFLEIEI